MYIFLDIDGVLVKEDPPGKEIDLNEDLIKFDATCLSFFENTVGKYAHSRIIISSSWREIFNLAAIKSLFSTEIAVKILGVTPILNYPVKYFRYQEILDYLKQHGLEEKPWIAIDDIAEHYPPSAPIIVTNPYRGFDKSAADKLDCFLSTLPKMASPIPEISKMPSSFPKPLPPKAQLPPFQISHEELNRDYAGYYLIEEEMEMVLKRFIELYYDEILASYCDSEGARIERLQIDAAGAGASKFVFGVFGKTANGEIPLIFGIRMYNNIGKMRDEEQLYDSASKYQVALETYDQKLAEVLVDELKVYQEFRELAKTSIDITSIWTRFPLLAKSIENQANNYLNRFLYIEDHELKRLMVNLGINAITVGEFVVGYDGRKILEREEFSLPEKISAIVHISNTLLQTWLLTLRYRNQHEFIGRTIVDLKPAQFVIQSNDIRKEEWMPAVVIDVGPAENTDNIYTYFKTINYMKKLIPAFATEMLKKLALPENEYQNARRIIYDNIIAYLDDCQNNHHRLNSTGEFFSLIEQLKIKLQ